MLIIFIMLAIAGIIGGLVWYTTTTKRFIDFLWPFVISKVIALCFLCIVWGISYERYVNCRTFFDGTKEQYASAVTMYSDYAEVDLKSAAWTDLKYQGYQENIAAFIDRLRRKIVGYNREIISKRVMAKNPFFSWLIVEPDEDMLIIKMTSNPSVVTGQQ